MDWSTCLAWGAVLVGLIMLLAEVNQVLDQLFPFFKLDVGEWFEPKVEIALTMLIVSFYILVQGWAIFLFLGSIVLALEPLVLLWGFGMPAPACITLSIIGGVLAVGIPLREKYLVGQDSAMEGFFVEFRDLFFRGRDDESERDKQTA